MRIKLFKFRIDQKMTDTGTIFVRFFQSDQFMKIVDTSVIKSFADLAIGFCDWCENTPITTDHASQISSWLCKLHAAALDLPKVGLGYWADELPTLPEAQLEFAKRNLSSLIGFYYSEYFDPDPLLISTNEPGLGDVGDDLLDIYKDLKHGIVDFQLGKVEGALWYWSRMHGDHWGRHAVGALFALHCLVISKDAKDEL